MVVTTTYWFNSSLLTEKNISSIIIFNFTCRVEWRTKSFRKCVEMKRLYMLQWYVNNNIKQKKNNFIDFRSNLNDYHYSYIIPKVGGACEAHLEHTFYVEVTRSSIKCIFTLPCTLNINVNFFCIQIEKPRHVTSCGEYLYYSCGVCWLLNLWCHHNTPLTTRFPWLYVNPLIIVRSLITMNAHNDRKVMITLQTSHCFDGVRKKSIKALWKKLADVLQPIIGWLFRASGKGTCVFV